MFAMVVLPTVSVTPALAAHTPTPREVLSLLRRADHARLVIHPPIGRDRRADAGCSYELPAHSLVFLGLTRLLETSLGLIDRDDGLGFTTDAAFTPTMTLIFSAGREEIAEIAFEDRDRAGFGVQMRMEKIAPPWTALRYRMTAIDNFVPKLMGLSKDAEVHQSCS